MTRHHPDTNLLVEYSNGSLPWAVSIMTAAHLHFCQKCRDHHHSLSALGGASLAHGEAVEVGSNSFDDLMNIISAQGEAKDAVTVWEEKTDHIAVLKKNTKRCRMSDSLPTVIQKLLPDENKLHWKWVSAGLRSARLKTGQSDYEVNFHRISKGSKVVEHDHKGMEYTLVLEGSFSDERGVYKQGDFIINRPGDIHRPTATQDQDCLCLSVCEAPVQVTGIVGKVINPFLRVRPV